MEAVTSFCSGLLVIIRTITLNKESMRMVWLAQTEINYLEVKRAGDVGLIWGCTESLYHQIVLNHAWLASIQLCTYSLYDLQPLWDASIMVKHNSTCWSLLSWYENGFSIFSQICLCQSIVSVPNWKVKLRQSHHCCSVRLFFMGSIYVSLGLIQNESIDITLC